MWVQIPLAINFNLVRSKRLFFSTTLPLVYFMEHFKWSFFFCFWLLLFTSLPSLQVKAETNTIDYKFIWPEGVITLHQKIDVACKQFGCDAKKLKKVMWCESKDDPKAINWTEPGQPSGLFQHKIIYWQGRTEKYGIPNANIFDPDAQIYITAQMINEFGYMWACK